MAIWLVAAIPVLVMFFALAMERLEHRLRHLAARENVAVAEHDVEEFLQAARPAEAQDLGSSEGGRALELLRPRRPAVVHSRRVGQRS